MADRGPKSKYWCITIHFTSSNVFEERDEECIEWFNEFDLSRDDTDYFIFARELGDNGDTPHAQAYVCFKTRKYLTGVKRWVKDHTAHCEVAKGKPKQCWNYCLKEGLEPKIEHGSPPATAQVFSIEGEGFKSCP